MAKGKKSKTPKRSFGDLKKANEEKAVERNKQAEANENKNKTSGSGSGSGGGGGKDKKEMSAAKVKSEALRHGGRTKDLFGNELNYVKFLDKYDIDYNDIQEIRKYGNRPDLGARAFYKSILNKGIASNPLDQDLVKRMLDYDVPTDKQGNPLFDSYKRIGKGDRELYGNPLKDVPFLSSIGEAIPNTRNDFASLVADSIVGIPGVTSMARGIMDKIAGGSGDYTSAQRYFKNYFPDDQAKVNQLALASLDPKFQRDVFESPVYAASQNYSGALSGTGGGIPSLASNIPPSSAQSYSGNTTDAMMINNAPQNTMLAGLTDEQKTLLDGRRNMYPEMLGIQEMLDNLPKGDPNDPATFEDVETYLTNNQSSVANEGGMDSVLAQIAMENQNNSLPYSFQDSLKNATADLNTSQIPTLDPRVNFNTSLGTFGVSPRGFDYNNQGAILDDKINIGVGVNPYNQSYDVGFNSYLPNDFGISGGYSSEGDGGIMASKFFPTDLKGFNGFGFSGGANMASNGQFDPTLGIATQIDPLQMLGLGSGPMNFPVTVDARGTYRDGRIDPSVDFNIPFSNDYSGLGYLFK